VEVPGTAGRGPHPVRVRQRPPDPSFTGPPVVRPVNEGNVAPSSRAATRRTGGRSQPNKADSDVRPIGRQAERGSASVS